MPPIYAPDISRPAAALVVRCQIFLNDASLKRVRELRVLALDELGGGKLNPLAQRLLCQRLLLS